MLPIRAFSAFHASSLALGFGVALSLASACSDDAAVSAPAAGAAGEASGTAGAPGQGGAGMSEGGGAATAGAPGNAGVAVAGDAGVAGAGVGGAPDLDGDCYVALSDNTSNAVDPTIPLSDTCKATRFDGQINFEVLQGMLPDGRDLNLDFFADPVAGANVKLEDGYDFASHQGAAASYIDSAGVWNADSGTVTIASVIGDTYVVKLTDLHFAVMGGQPMEPTASGAFIANGTITATATSAR